MFSSQPPPSSPPTTPVTVDPLIHGAPLVPSTSPSHASDGNPLGVSRAASQPMGPPPTPGG